MYLQRFASEKSGLNKSENFVTVYTADTSLQFSYVIKTGKSMKEQLFLYLNR